MPRVDLMVAEKYRDGHLQDCNRVSSLRRSLRDDVACRSCKVQILLQSARGLNEEVSLRFCVPDLRVWGISLLFENVVFCERKARTMEAPTVVCLFSRRARLQVDRTTSYSCHLPWKRPLGCYDTASSTQFTDMLLRTTIARNYRGVI